MLYENTTVESTLIHEQEKLISRQDFELQREWMSLRAENPHCQIVTIQLVYNAKIQKHSQSRSSTFQPSYTSHAWLLLPATARDAIFTTSPSPSPT